MIRSIARDLDWVFFASVLLLAFLTLVVAYLTAGSKRVAIASEQNVSLSMDRERLRSIEFRENLEKEREAEREGRPVDRVR